MTKENKKDERPQIKRRFDRSDLLSVFAVIISIGAFVVSLYEAGIMKQQQAVMVDQQKASVWPYLEHYIAYSFQNNTAELEIALTNKGVGPAKMGASTLKIHQQEVVDYSDIRKAIEVQFPENVWQSINYSFGFPSGILSADESFTILNLKSNRFPNDQEVLRDLAIEYIICYCSIYGECWRLEEDNQEPIEGCD